MPRQRLTPRGRLRQLAAAGGIAALAALASAAAAGGAAASSARPASPQQVTVAVTSISPQIARPGKRVTVSGIVSNPTGRPVADLAVQLWSSTARFTTRSQLASYAAGELPVDTPVTGAVDQLAGSLKPGATRHWTVTVPVATLGFASGFGVYPLAAQLDSAGSPVADAYTFLPFWPGSARAAGLTHPEQLAWIWPLIGQPEQAACHSLLNDGLAGSLASTGRLGGLLADGTSPAGLSASLTWAIDPSLLSSAALMTHSYQVGGTPTCTGTETRRASPAARAWLAEVHALAQQQDFFTTPYADVDMSALAHAGLDNDLARALSKGREVTASPSLLGGVQRPANTARIAWPADGIADYGVLGSLAANGIGSVVLNSSMMPPRRPVRYTPSAITSTPDGVNAGLRVALADSTLTQVLADAPTAAHTSYAATSSAAASFNTEQRFLAETAMIAAESPGLPRSVVITPPRQWNPAPGLARQLLAETDQAPWLRPASLSNLLAKHPGPGQVARKQPPPQQAGPGELHKSLLRKVRGLEAAIKVQAQRARPAGRPVPVRRGGGHRILSLARRPARGQAAAVLGLRLRHRPVPPGAHRPGRRPGHADRQVRAGASLHRQQAGPAGHRPAAGPGAGQPADHPVQVGPGHYRQVPAEDGGGPGALLGRGLHHTQSEPARAGRVAAARAGPPRSPWTRPTSAPRRWSSSQWPAACSWSPPRSGRCAGAPPPAQRLPRSGRYSRGSRQIAGRNGYGQQEARAGRRHARGAG